MVNYNDIFNNPYNEWIRNKIAEANARGLLPEGSENFISKQQGFRMVGQPYTTPKQLPMVSGNTLPDIIRNIKPQPQPSVINMYPSDKIKLLTYDPSKKILDSTLGKQTAFKLPNGSYTSDKELANIARQQIAKAKKQALTKTAIKGLGVIPTAIQFYKDIAFPIANDLYHGFIKGDIDNSKVLQAALNLANLNRNSKNIVKENSNNNSMPPLEVLDENKLTGGKSVQVGGQGSVKKVQSNEQNNIQAAQQIANQLAGEPQTKEQQANNLQAINDYISQLKDIQQPYVEALQNYLDNYNRMYNQSQLANRRLRDLSVITGDPTWYQSAKDYNPLTQEANRVSAIKQLQDAEAGNIDAINEVMGNMAIAKEMDLPYEAAFANKNLLTALTSNRKNLTDWEKAQLAAELKRYGIDVGYNKAIDVQGMRGNTAKDVALINSMAYGYGGMGGPAPGLNQQGTIPMVYQNLPQTTQQQADPRAQFFPSK